MLRGVTIAGVGGFGVGDAIPVGELFRGIRQFERSESVDFWSSCGTHLGNIIELAGWLKDFVNEFVYSHEIERDAIRLNIGKKKIKASMDPGQLNQVMWNLCENALRYSNKIPLLTIACDVRDDSKRPYIDITDSGTGIPTDVEHHLFEPFFTTSPKGAGLGLYIAKDLCEANQATLNLQSNSINGCTFRINFSHPEKQHILV